MKICTVVGARPQFIKAGSVSREVSLWPDVEEVLIHTGQHFDINMSQVFFDEMGLPVPAYNLGVSAMSHGAMTGKMIEKIEEVLIRERPNVVLLYGDTNSTLAGAIAAAKLNIKVAHVEAGLRSYNRLMPEEVNRVLTDNVSDYLFCPTERAVEALKKEGRCAGVKNVGDVMYDGALYYSPYSVRPEFDIPSKYTLCTVHRAENTSSYGRLKEIVSAVNTISESCPVVMPLHPATKKKLLDYGLAFSSGVMVLDPVGYLNMIWLVSNCEVVVTDSGGLQKEAYFFGKYCLTMRDETEWVELVDSKANYIVGASESEIINGFSALDISCREPFDEKLYGDGFAARRIIGEIVNGR